MEPSSSANPPLRSRDSNQLEGKSVAWTTIRFRVGSNVNILYKMLSQPMPFTSFGLIAFAVSVHSFEEMDFVSIRKMMHDVIRRLTENAAKCRTSIKCVQLKWYLFAIIWQSVCLEVSHIFDVCVFVCKRAGGLGATATLRCIIPPRNRRNDLNFSTRCFQSSHTHSNQYPIPSVFNWFNSLQPTRWCQANPYDVLMQTIQIVNNC